MYILSEVLNWQSEDQFTYKQLEDSKVKKFQNTFYIILDDTYSLIFQNFILAFTMFKYLGDRGKEKVNVY